MEPDPGAPDPPEQRGSGQDDPGLDPDWNPEDDGPLFAWLPPEDRLWRHPSEGQPHRASLHQLPVVSPKALGLARAVGRTTWAVAVIAGLVGAVAATGIGLGTGLWPTRPTTIVKSVAPTAPSLSVANIGTEPINWTAIDDSVAASVVTITVTGAAGTVVGSGVVFLNSVDGDSFIVTDRSLFAADQTAGYLGSIRVAFRSGQEGQAKLLYEDSLSGLALLKVTHASFAVPAGLGSVASLNQAATLLAVGAGGSASAPAGLVSLGTVSGEDVTVNASDGSDLDGLLSVTMDPVPASSAGGPLLDQYGQVVGIIVSVDPTDPADEQYTFAVPVDEVSRLANEIIAGDPITHPWLGIVDAADVPSVMAHQLGVSGGVQAGGVEPGSPAQEVGLRSNDVITSLAGKTVSSAGELVADLNACVPGKKVEFSFVHAGQTVKTFVRLGNEPQDG